MFRNRKDFIHYCRVSVKDGLNIELSTSNLLLEKFNREIFQSYTFCHCVREIKKVFTKNCRICDSCMSLLENEDQDNPKIHIIWRENQKYRVFSNFYCDFLDRLFRCENIKNKCGKIDNKTIEKHINAHINDSFIKDIKKSSWVALHLLCSYVINPLTNYSEQLKT